MYSPPMIRPAALVAVLVALLGMSCGGNSTGPAGPTPTEVSIPTVRGVIVATNGGQPIAAVTLTARSVVATSTPAGAFELRGAPQGERVTLTGPSIITRATWLQSQLVAFRAEGFDLGFYQALARNGFERADALQPIRRWTRAPRLYLKTVDEAGQPIDQVTLDTVSAAMQSSAGSFTGDQFGIAGIERGEGSREGMPGWITVKWPNPAALDNCGRAQVGFEGGWIELNYLYGTRCSCGGVSRVAPSTARHEIAHALGYYHTGRPSDLLYGLPRTTCVVDFQPSSKELQYARYVYSRPPGNRDPDEDPIGPGALSVRDRVAPVIVD